MSDKTGIERLRGYADRIEQCEATDKWRETARKLRDMAWQIECETLPLPRFEDGRPAQLGDWFEDERGEERELTSVSVRMTPDGGTAYVLSGNGFVQFGDRVRRPKSQDTQEAIDADALKDPIDYWKCRGEEEGECPVRIGGKTPKELYGVDDCQDAMCLDLLRRQRELCERGDGE